MTTPGNELCDAIGSLEIREKGNALYKEGNVADAAKAYIKASTLDPLDPKPLSNLSAMYYEMGLYGKCINTVNKCMGLELSPEDRRAFALKQSHRMFKSMLYRGRHGNLRASMDKYDFSNGGDYTVYRTTLEHVETTFRTFPEERNARRRIVMRLPRYKPRVSSMDEYFHFGADNAWPIFDDSLAEAAFENGISILYSGAADARTLYTTLLAIKKFKTRTGQNVKNIHVTVNDIQAPTIARFLIVFSLLQQLAEASDSADGRRTTILITLFYVYCGHIVPPCATDHLQRTISGLIRELNGGKVVSSVISAPGYEKNKLLESLLAWQGEVYGMIKKDQVAERITEGNSRFPLAYVPPGCEKEQTLWSTTGELQLPSSYRGKQEASASTGNQAWKINPTLFDVVLERPSKFVTGGAHQCYFNPFSLADNLYAESELKMPKKRTCLYDYVAPFFVEVASAIKLLGARLSIDTVHGEMTAVMEKIRYGFLDGQDNQEYNGSEAKRLPTRYDRVYMSNIPDYVGGPLTSFLYAIPLTKETRSSWITSNCLRNGSIWPNQEDFLNEYLAIHAPNDCSRLLQVDTIETRKKNDTSNPVGDATYPMFDYINWRRLWNKYYSFSQLLPRLKLQKWLSQLFFKLAVPADKRHLQAHQDIYSPLNLTIFLRLLSRLHEVGYPGHWLGEFLVKLLEDDLTTAARPPRSAPLNREETDKGFSLKKLTTQPYISELSTLTALFLRILPFAVITTSLPMITDIHLYNLRFTDIDYRRGSMAVTAIMFFHKALFRDACGTPGPLIELRRLFDPPDEDEAQNTFSAARLKNLREHGLVLWSTFDWDKASKTAEVWMRKDFVEKMKADCEWHCCLMRTDFWFMQSACQPVGKVTADGRRWVDED